jgi:hypothetical protein
MNNAEIEESSQDKLVFVGHARLPQSLSPSDAPIILVELEVAGENDLITAVEVSGPLPTANRLLACLLLGRSMQTDYEAAVVEFQRRYMGPPQRALCTALNNAHELYLRHLRRSRLEPFLANRLIN